MSEKKVASRLVDDRHSLRLDVSEEASNRSLSMICHLREGLSLPMGCTINPCTSTVGYISKKHPDMLEGLDYVC